MDTVTHTEGTASGVRTPYRGRLLPRPEEATGNGRSRRPERMATALGWFSIGLGIAELVAPGRVARLIGLDDPEGRTLNLVRLMGLREIGAGLGILGNDRTPGWLWARVAGDALDVALLARAGATEGAHRQRTALATLAVLGVTAMDIVTADRLDGRAGAAGRLAEPKGIHVRRSITVDRPRQEVYQYWRRLDNLPRFMKHLEEVRETGDRRSHWKTTAPAGRTVEWDAEMIADVPGERIAWRSVEGSQVENAGEVRFLDAPGGRGTEIHVDIRYDPPGGRVTAAIAKLFNEEPGQQVRDDLYRFKQVMETGEVVLSDATIDRGPHPARPSGGPEEEQ